MRYLKTYEKLIDKIDQEDFINEIANYFQDIVDKYNLEKEEFLTTEDETPGIFYNFFTYGLELDKPDPYLQINLWCGIDHLDKFQQMGPDIYHFVKLLEGLGYKVECDNIRQYMEWVQVEGDLEESFDITIYYK